MGNTLLRDAGPDMRFLCVLVFVFFTVLRLCRGLWAS